MRAQARPRTRVGASQSLCHDKRAQEQCRRCLLSWASLFEDRGIDRLLHDVVPDSDATGIRAVNKCANVYVAPIHPRNRVANG